MKSSPFTFDYIQRAVQINHLNLDWYPHEEIYNRLDKIADQSTSPHDDDVVHCGVLAGSYSRSNYDHARGMMSVYFCSTVNPDGVAYLTAVHNVDCKKVAGRLVWYRHARRPSSAPLRRDVAKGGYHTVRFGITAPLLRVS